VLPNAKDGTSIFNDPVMGIFIYWWLNTYNGRTYPKVGIAEVVKVRKGSDGKPLPEPAIMPRMVRYKASGGATVRHTPHFYFNVPDIPGVCAELMKIYEKVKPEWEKVMGSINDVVAANQPVQPMSGGPTQEEMDMWNQIQGGKK
jgi:hypothetical protein